MSLALLGILNSQAAGGGGAPAMELIATNLLASDVTSLTFSGIPADYKHLQIRATVRTNSGPFSEYFGIRVNNRSTSGQYAHWLEGNGSGVTSVSHTNNFLRITEFAPGANATDGSFMPVICDILDYTNTNKLTTLRTFAGYTDSNTPINRVYLTSALYPATNAVTSLVIGSFAGPQLAAGSRFSLYGIRGE